MDSVATKKTPKRKAKKAPKLERSTLAREVFLTQACDHILDKIIMPVVGDAYPRPEFKISVGFPKNQGKKAIAQCWKKVVSRNKINEIFTTPALDDTLRIFDVLAHELIHAVDDCASGHRGFFAKTARAIGLEGKLTATVAGKALTGQLESLVAKMGHIPHGRMDITKGLKKQTTRMLKIHCPKCDFIARASAKAYDMITSHTCPACGAKDSWHVT